MAKEINKENNMREFKYCVRYKSKRTVRHHQCTARSRNQKMTTNNFQRSNCENFNYNENGNQQVKKFSRNPVIHLNSASKSGKILEDVSETQNCPLSMCYSNNCEPIDKDVFENMKDSIKSFMMEKANRLRNVVSKTASVFEGEGESNSNEDSYLERQHASEIWASKKVFLKSLCESAKHFQAGKIKKSGIYDVAAYTVSNSKNINSTLSDQDNTFESIGLMNSTIFSDMRVSKEKLYAKKRIKKGRRCSYTTKSVSKSNITVSNKKNENHGLNELLYNEDENSAKKSHRDIFLACDVFESVGENNKNDYSNIGFAFKNQTKLQSRRKRNKKCSSSSPNHSERFNKYYSKFTLCKHACFHINRNHGQRRVNSIIRSEPTPKAPIEGTMLSCEPAGKAKETPSGKRYISSQENNIDVSSQIYHCQMKTKVEINKNKKGYAPILQFCIPNNGDSLLFDNDSSSIGHPSEKHCHRNPRHDPSMKKPLEKCKGSSTVVTTKSLCTLQSQTPQKVGDFLPTGYGESEKDCRKTLSDSVLSKFSEIIGDPSSRNNRCKNQSTKHNKSSMPSRISKDCGNSNNEENLNIHKEDIYECSSGSSRFLKVKHYVKLNQIPKTEISETPIEFVGKYTLDISGLGQNKSWESLAMKRKTFDSLHRIPINYDYLAKDVFQKLRKPAETGVTEHYSETKDTLKETAGEKNVPQADLRDDTAKNVASLNLDKTYCISDKKYNNPFKNSISKKKIEDHSDLHKKQNSEETTRNKTFNFSNNEQNKSRQNASLENCRNQFVTHVPKPKNFSPKRTNLKAREKYDYKMAQNGFCTTNDDIENMKLKFENNFSNAYLKKQTSEELKQPCRVIMKALKTSKNKVMSLFYPLT